MSTYFYISDKYNLPIQYHDQVPKPWKKYFKFLTYKQFERGENENDTEMIESFSDIHYRFRKPLIDWYTQENHDECICESVKLPAPYSHLVLFSDLQGVYIPIEFRDVHWVGGDDQYYSIGSLPMLIRSLKKLKEIIPKEGLFGERVQDLISYCEIAMKEDKLIILE